MSTSAKLALADTDPAELDLVSPPRPERAPGAGALPLASHGEFRVYWINMASRVVGRSMVTAALAWLALDITGPR